MIDLQKAFDELPIEAKTFLLQRHDTMPEKNIQTREDFFIMYLVENNIEQAQEILDQVLFDPKITIKSNIPYHPIVARPCKKCLGRYYTGKEVKGDRKAPILCKCFYKNLEKRNSTLNIKWELTKDEQKGT